MGDINEWIAEAGTELGHAFERCSPELACEVVAAARERFVIGDPRV